MARRGWQREVHAGAQIYTALCILSVGPTELCVGGCSVPGGPGAALTAVSAHSYRTLATEHEALMQKYLHLLQIVETEKTVAKQLRQQIEDGEIEIERLKAEVRGGPGSAGTAPGADVGVVSHVAAGGGSAGMGRGVLGGEMDPGEGWGLPAVAFCLLGFAMGTATGHCCGLHREGAGGANRVHLAWGTSLPALRC